MLYGNDLGLKRKLTEFDQKPGLKGSALLKMGGEQMFHLLHSALCMVGRPGAGLTSEALARGTPMVFDLSCGVMPQESNNLNFWKSRRGRPDDERAESSSECSGSKDSQNPN